MPSLRDPHRVPVIALTGYLGSGRTTLLNHLLLRPGARIGAVVNDFGALNVDAALVAAQIDEAASISGGCLCCLPDSGGLDEALHRLSHSRLRLDAIVVEASGAAGPGRARGHRDAPRRAGGVGTARHAAADRCGSPGRSRPSPTAALSQAQRVSAAIIGRATENR